MYFIQILDREMEKRKHESRTELQARREERRRRGLKRSVTPEPEEAPNKKNKTEKSPRFEEAVVTVSDASDVEMKSDDSNNSEPEEGKVFNILMQYNIVSSIIALYVYTKKKTFCQTQN